MDMGALHDDIQREAVSLVLHMFCPPLLQPRI